MCSHAVRRLAVAAVVSLSVGACASNAPESVTGEAARFAELVDLPPPDLAGDEPLESVLSRRRSEREFADRAVGDDVLGQLLWAGQGITDDAGHRTAPSAGATYPLELYVITATSIAHYVPEGHRLERRPDTAVLGQLGDAAFDQGFVATAPAVVVIAGSVARTSAEYGAVADELMQREAGHAAQNILLQATALELSAVPVGGFDPGAIERLLLLAPGEEVLYLVPIGHPADDREP